MAPNIEKDKERQSQGEKRMLTWMIPKKLAIKLLPVPNHDERKLLPVKTTNLFSRVFFWWIFPVMKTGYTRTLVPEDLFVLTEDAKVETMAKVFFEYFATGLAQARANHILLKCKHRKETVETSTVTQEEDLKDYELLKSTILMAVIKTFKVQYFISCLCFGIASILQVTLPLLLKKLIEFVSMRAAGEEPYVGRGIGYAFGCLFFVFVSGILMNHFYYRAELTGAQTKAVLIKALLKKSFILSPESRHKYSTGKITSMLGTDLERVDLGFGMLPMIFVFPIPFLVSIIILSINIGAAAGVGIGVLIVFMLLGGYSIGVLLDSRTLVSKLTDKRVAYMKEVLSNLRIIKYYAWEPPYHENISKIRREEMGIIFKMQVIRSVALAVAMSLTSISSMVAFLVLYKIGGSKRTAANIFSSLSLFNVLTISIVMLPMAMASGADGILGLGRVGKYLASSEIDSDTVKTIANSSKTISMESNNIAIEVEEGTFEWESFDEEEDEEETNKQEELEKKEKDEKYKNATKADKKVIKLAAKEEKKLKKEEKKKAKLGKKTGLDTKKLIDKEISEGIIDFPGLKNISLSITKGEFVVVTGLIGSGKSSLLNALSGFMKRTQGSVHVNGSLLLCGYPWVQNATVKENIIFDSEYNEKRYQDVIYACSLESDLEVFTAGDQTEVGERGITLSGGQKARVNLARAVYAGKDIILLDDVLSAVDARVGEHIMDNCLLGMLKDSTRILATHQLSLIGAADRIIFLNGDGSVSTGTFKELKKSNVAFASLMTFTSYNQEKEVSDATETKTPESKHPNVDKDDDKGKLILDEEMAVNRISWSIYGNYISTGAGKFPLWVILPAFITFASLSTFFELFTNAWLSFWTEYKFEGRSNGFYIGFYVLFSMLAVACLTIEFVILVYLTNTASVALNVYAIDRVLHAPMSFMDTTPMGRILNRFTKDTDALDNEIGDEIAFFLMMFCNIIGVIVMCIIYLPWFAIAVPFLGYIFVAVADYYQASAREIKRLEAVQRSHVYNNFNETLTGMATIKAYGQEKRFVNKNDVLINNMNEASYLTIANQRWLGIHLDLIATAFSMLISLLCVCKVFKLSPASVGLLLVYVLQISSDMSNLMRTFTLMENAMNSVERMSEYAFKLPQEAQYLVTETTPCESWPASGEISFENVGLSYRPGLPFVLKDVSFKVKASEKIGICGRTGAGKSSIMTALCRLGELQKGSIAIDGIDISSLGLTSLRKKLSIIPQDPVLFIGSVRKNLDPFNEHSDEKLWNALRSTGLIEATDLESVKNQVEEKDSEPLHKFHLNQLVEDEGSNFSLGERQLIAFARALIRNTKILILDEATSSVDYETDSKIQKTIVKEFGHCTILCIAHRLKTILNYDRILVLDNGEVKEFDTPKNLFDIKGGLFHQMCVKSNVTDEDFVVSPLEG